MRGGLCRDHLNEQKRNWTHANPEKVHAYTWKYNHKDATTMSDIEEADARLAKHREAQNRYNEKLKTGAPIQHRPADMSVKCLDPSEVCRYCGEKVPKTSPYRCECSAEHHRLYWQGYERRAMVLALSGEQSA